MPFPLTSESNISRKRLKLWVILFYFFLFFIFYYFLLFFIIFYFFFFKSARNLLCSSHKITVISSDGNFSCCGGSHANAVNNERLSLFDVKSSMEPSKKFCTTPK